MDLNLLHTYITLLVERTYSKGFRFDKFKKLAGEEQFEYVDENLRSLGKGSSRWAYLLNSKRVLKLSISEAGVEQNKNELNAFQNPLSRRFTARILAYAPDMSWLVSELVRPLHSEEAGMKEFQALTGVSFELMIAVLYANKNPTNNDDFIRDAMQKDNGFLRDLLKFVKKADLASDDISIPQQWGKTPDGRAVLLDYGLTLQTWKKHYSQAFD